MLSSALSSVRAQSVFKTSRISEPATWVPGTVIDSVWENSAAVLCHTAFPFLINARVRTVLICGKKSHFGIICLQG